MKKFLVITIDVEPDCSAGWRYSDPLTFRGVSTGIAKLLHPLFSEFEVVPTYLINNVVLEDGPSVEILRHLPGSYELGAHLHPEFIEPERRFPDYAGKKGEANCCFYPPEIESAKIGSITELFEKAIGYRPTSFRAGRYSAGSNTMKSLHRYGYLVDTSLTPHVRWDDATREQPVDFTHAPEQPYFMAEKDILSADPNGPVLQVPISIALKKRNPLREIVSSGAGLIHPYRRTRAVWLRPFYSSSAQMIGIARQYLRTYRHSDIVVLNMMFHNVEVIPGLSPYTRTENESRIYLQQLKDFFTFCRQEHFSGVGLSALYKIFK